MKLPLNPKPFNKLFEKIQAVSGSKKVYELLYPGVSPTHNKRYYPWDKIRHLSPPDGFSTDEWWLGIKFARSKLYQPLPIEDKNNTPFKLASIDLTHQALHEIDRDAAGAIIAKDGIFKSSMRESAYIQSLFEESITSSQLEGAATTRKDAKQMLREGRKPRDRSEQMIYNNYLAMRYIQRIKNESLSRENLLELHGILTENTLDDPSGAGRYRRSDEDYKVYDDEGQILHDPPLASALEERMDLMIKFANGDNHDNFIHPVVRSILLHFWLSYNHPFIDGNGRTARALFYWSMASQKYWLIEYISISSILKKAPAQYAWSFLYTEGDDNDMTYFLLYQLKVIQRAIATLYGNLKIKIEQIQETELLLRQNRILFESLNHRQLALINHGLRNPQTSYSIESHRGSNNITYQTARTDLLKLAELGLLEQYKRGKAFHFVLPPDLRSILKDSSP